MNEIHLKVAQEIQKIVDVDRKADEEIEKLSKKRKQKTSMVVSTSCSGKEYWSKRICNYKADN